MIDFLFIVKGMNFPERTSAKKSCLVPLIMTDNSFDNIYEIKAVQNFITMLFGLAMSCTISWASITFSVETNPLWFSVIHLLSMGFNLLFDIIKRRLGIALLHPTNSSSKPLFQLLYTTMDQLRIPYCLLKNLGNCPCWQWTSINLLLSRCLLLAMCMIDQLVAVRLAQVVEPLDFGVWL